MVMKIFLLSRLVSFPFPFRFAACCFVSFVQLVINLIFYFWYSHSVNLFFAWQFSVYIKKSRRVEHQIKISWNMEFRINTLTTFSSTFGWLINKCPPTCPYQKPNMSSQVYKINSHGDLSLVAAWMNLIFTSHSIDFQLISTYFSLFVADFSDFFLHSSLWCSRRFMLFFHSSRYFFSKLRQRKERKKYKYLFRLPILPPSEWMCLVLSARDRSCVCTQAAHYHVYSWLTLSDVPCDRRERNL